ncbi:hypothetical protein EMIT0P100_130090 [Pseudomonas sp. IT-P100]
MGRVNRYPAKTTGTQKLTRWDGGSFRSISNKHLWLGTTALAEMRIAVVVIIEVMHRSCCWDARSFDPVFELSNACRAS